MNADIAALFCRSAPLARLLEEELIALAAQAESMNYAAGAMILHPDGGDERLFVLRHGAVALRIRMLGSGGRCGGEATFTMASAGQAFGWAAWVRADRIAVSACALGPTSLVAVDPRRLRDRHVSLKVGQRMLQVLYGLLQESGLCPPNIGVLLKLGDVMP